MKNITKILVFLAAQMVLFGSCLGSDKVETAPECAIVSVTVGDVKSMVKETYYRENGVPYDTIVPRTISGSEIRFNIDQTGGRIYSTDSLPHWTDITKMCPTVAAYGNVAFKQAKNTDFIALNSGKDSLDFTEPVELRVTSTDGASVRFYQWTITKRQIETDTLIWKKAAGTTEGSLVFGSETPSQMRACRLGKKVYVFFNSVLGGVAVSSTDIELYAKPWHIAKAHTADEDIDLASIIAYNSKFFALDTKGQLCTSLDGETWHANTSRTFDQIVAADNLYLYAMAAGTLYYTQDGEAWEEQDIDNADMLPATYRSCFEYEAATNPDLYPCSMVGISLMGKTVSWHKVSSKDNTVNQKWEYIQQTADNQFPMPQFDEIVAFRHKDHLWITGKGGKDGSTGYSVLYMSPDNGITWHPLTTKYLLPKGLQTNGTISIVSIDEKIVLIQSDGSVWEGNIR